MFFTYTLLIILVMLGLNAVFAAYEMALAAVSRARLTALAQQKKKGAEEAVFMKERIEASLAVIQLGITLVGVIAAALGGAGADEAFSPYLQERFQFSLFWAEFWALALFIVPLSATTIIFGELVPKTIALYNREWVCLKLSAPMKFLYIVFFPLVTLFEKIVKGITAAGSRNIKKAGTYESTHIHELKAVASMARTSRMISAREEKIVHSASELSIRPVKDIMIPASAMFMIPLNLTLSDALIRAHLDMHTRFPVCSREGDPQSIIGYVNFKDIVFALHANPVDPTLKGIVRPITSYSAGARISAVLEEMIQGSIHIAVVKDDKAVVLGMVTLEDILEELVGEIQDEYDRLPNYIHPYLDGWIMGGGVLIDKIAATTGAAVTALPGVKPPTLAEWCYAIKKMELKGGDMFEKDGLAIVVRKLRRNQLSEALVRVVKN